MMIFDTETTGLIDNLSTRSERQPEVIEFCGIRITDEGKIVSDLDMLIKPSLAITEEITGKNGIDNAMVSEAPAFRDVASIIRDFIESSDVIYAHNAAFDRDMIDIEFARLGMTKIAWPHIVCTVEATLHLMGYRLSLSALYEHLFGEKFAGAHRARADVEALIRCIVELKKRGEM